MSKKRFNSLLHKLQGKKPLLAVLIDPDKFNEKLVLKCNKSGVSCFLVGGSVLEKGDLHATVKRIKALSSIPVLLFPGDERQLDKKADGLLLLSLLSGRNPEYLIGKHVKAAPIIRKMKLPHLSVAYLLVDGGRPSSTQKVTKTLPLNASDRLKIVNTAIAAELLGFGAIYLEAGSGAKQSIRPELLRAVKKQVNIPLIVGGGINKETTTRALIKAGANMLVLGNALEKDVHLVEDIGRNFRS